MLEGVHHYLQCYNRVGPGVSDFVVDAEKFGSPIDLEEHFRGVRYKSITGIYVSGEPRRYSETFVEDEGVDVYIPEGDAKFGMSDVTLSLYIFGKDFDDVSKEEKESTARANINEVYSELLSYLSSSYVCYWDSVRMRKVMLEMSASPSVKQDVLYGLPMLQVDFKFKNVFGRSFDLDFDFAKSSE